MSEIIILFIAAAGVLQAIILAGMLYFHPKSDRSVTLFLSLHILTVSIFMIMPVVQYLFSWHYIGALMPFQLLIGPFLYFYIRSFKETITWQKAWPHLLLFVAVSIFMFSYYIPWATKYPAGEKPPAEVLLSPVSYGLVIARNLQMVLYYLLSRRALKRYQQSIRQLYSETSRINLNWVNWLISGFLLLLITVFLLVYFITAYPEHFSLFILINTAVIVPYIYVVAIKGLAQPTLWQIMPDTTKAGIEKEINEVEVMVTVQTAKEENPSPPDTGPDPRMAGIVSKIVRLLEEEKVYQEPELTIKNLSDKIQVPYYQLSQAINEVMKKSFYDLVNGYRVEEAKRLLLDPKNRNYTILSVGFEAGFNSKTAFNTVFKKFTGYTPTEYRNKQG